MVSSVVSVNGDGVDPSAATDAMTLSAGEEAPKVANKGQAPQGSVMEGVNDFLGRVLGSNYAE
jgi:hypothetical protein